nr:hypothetical protein [Tanacetum cinerariifolium]
VHGERPEGNLKQLKTMKVNKSKLEDIPIVREFPDVFLEDLSGLPPSRVDLKAQLQDKGIVISELKKLIEKLKEKSVDTKFEKSSVIRQPNAFKRVIPTTSVSRPQLKSNPMGDRVMHNNSQGKNQEVEDQRRNVKFYKNKTPVTACNDSLNAMTLNVNSVCATCDTCVLNDKHDMCVLNSVAKSLKKTVSSKSNQKPRNITRKQYERISKTCSWWYPKFTPSGYKWKPKCGKENVNSNTSMPLGSLIEIVLFIVDSGCSKHMTRNLKLLINFVEKFLRTVKYGNDQIAPILGYGDLVQGLNHNLLSVGQFCDADLEVTFQKSTCFIRDLKGNDLLTCSRGTDLYSITLQDTNCPNPICLMAKASSSQAWLWHRRLSHLNFDTINLLSKNDIVNLHAYFATKGILHQTSVARTPEKNDVVERQNRTLVEAARTMLSVAKVPLFFSIKDHPLEQVIGNPSQSVRTRRQLESDGKMYMFALTVNRTEPKNIKEGMADSAWIESMQEELHQFD